MADQEDQVEQPEAKPAGGSKGKIMIAAIIAVIMIVECAIAYFVIPDPEAVAKKVRNEIAQQQSLAEGDDQDLFPAADDGPLSEVELGQFTITVHQHTSNTTLNISCTVMATVSNKDKSEFDTLLANNHNRLREKIMFEFRSAKVTDLTDPGLGLIKRRILEKSNALFGKPILRSVMLPEYNFYQQ